MQRAPLHRGQAGARRGLVGRGRFTPIETHIDSAWFQLLKLQYDKLLFRSRVRDASACMSEEAPGYRLGPHAYKVLPTFAFNFNLLLYGLGYRRGRRGGGRLRRRHRR
jgi:hypothetical protein